MQPLHPDTSNESVRINLKEYFENYKSLVKTKMPWAFKGSGLNTENYSAAILGRQIPQEEYVAQEEACRYEKLYLILN